MATSAASHHTRTYLAGADLSASQWCAAALSTSAAKTAILSTASNTFVGVIESPGKPQTGYLSPGSTIETKTYPTSVAVVIGKGVMCKAKAGGAITVGAPVKVGSGGKFVAASSTDLAVGYAESATAADGDLFSLLITANFTAP